MQSRLLIATFVMVLACGFAYPDGAEGAWPTDPTVNLPVCTDLSDQVTTMAVSDGSGGAIFVWLDHRSVVNREDVYAQKVDANGVVQWTTDGVAICADTLLQEDPQIVSDGSGGAIIAWVDRRGSDRDIYARRVDTNGNVLWTSNGVAICTASQDQTRPRLIADGSGGAIITWEDDRLAVTNIYGQRVDANGTTLWAANGEALFDSPLACGGNFAYHDITTDGAGGLILAAMALQAPSDIVAQRVDSNGNYLWDGCGEVVADAANSAEDPLIVHDGSGGAIIAWVDNRNAPAVEMYAQRVDASGDTLWTLNGIPVCTGAGTFVDLEFDMIPDGAGGAILAWNDYNGSHLGLFSQRVDASGNALWTANGVQTATLNGFWPEMASDDLNGAIIVWNQDQGGNNVDQYAQRVNSSGTLLWTAGGVPITTAPERQEFPTIVSDGAGGAIIGWEDSRTTTQFDIYAQRITSDGQLGAPPPVPTLSEWGMILVVVMLLIVGAAVIRRREASAR